MHYLRALFSAPDEVLSRERVRNEIAREKLSRERLMRKSEEETYRAETDQIDNELRVQREAYAAEAKPYLDEFDDLSLAQHYYQEVSNIVSSHLHIVTQLSERELGEFGYMSKKLISVGLNLEALKCRMASGAPFEPELTTALKDAESEDLSIVAAPLFHMRGIPPTSAVRAAAFDLARAIEEMGKGAPLREPPRGWLDFLKFRTNFSPTMLEVRQIHARRTAKLFLSHIEHGEHHRALSIVEEMYADANREGGSPANVALFKDAFVSFRNTVLPTISADIFLRYARASLNASRFASVEKMLKE